MARVILDWKGGDDVPEALRQLPAGRYIVESVDDLPELTEEEEEGIRSALASLRAGKGRSLDQVRETIKDSLRR